MSKLDNSATAQIRVLAQAIFEIRVLLSGYIGSADQGDERVRMAAHLAYALHNEALAVLEGGSLDIEESLSRVRAVDSVFGEDFSTAFETAISES
ncbi:MAG: hypothetical protein AAF089_17545 [Bacteroidota bacterium]